MDEIVKLVHYILDEHHAYSERDSLDDTEMIKALKFVLRGVRNYLETSNETEEIIDGIIDDMKEFSKGKYVKVYVSNFEEDSELTNEEKVEEATYYFEYLYKHENHPY